MRRVDVYVGGRVHEGHLLCICKGSRFLSATCGQPTYAIVEQKQTDTFKVL